MAAEAKEVEIEGRQVYRSALRRVEIKLQQYVTDGRRQEVLLKDADADAWPRAPKSDETGIRPGGTVSDPTAKRAGELSGTAKEFADICERMGKVDVAWAGANLSPLQEELLKLSVMLGQSEAGYRSPEAIGADHNLGRSQAFWHRTLALYHLAQGLLHSSDVYVQEAG